MNFIKIPFLIFALGWSHACLGAQSIKNIHKVVILGGGLAGLTAAEKLAEKGVKSLVIEGRERLGGRVNTHYFNPQKTAFFEEGGTFIDSDHKATIALAKKLNVDLVKHGFGTKKLSVFDNARPVEPARLIKEIAEIKAVLESIQKDFQANHFNYYEINGANYYWNPLIKYIHNSKLSDFGKNMLKAILESNEGIPFEKVSVYDIHYCVEIVDQYFQLFSHKNSSWKPNFLADLAAYHYTAQKGMSHFVSRLDEELQRHQVPIQLNQELTQIGKTHDHYVLTFKSGEQVRASNVIMTLPFSTLRYVKIDPTVAVPPLTQDAIQTLSYGTNSKIGIQTTAPAKLSDTMLYYVNAHTSTIAWPGENAVTYFVSGHAGQNVTAESALGIAEAEKANILHEYPTIKFTGNPAFKNWTKDKFSFGSYSAISSDCPGAFSAPSDTYKEMSKYADPIDNDHFVFAGEHTRADGTRGHIEGAVRSGILAATILMKHVK